MRHFNNSIVVALATLLLLVSISSAQQTSTTAVPNLVRYSGTLKDAQGAAVSASTAVGVTFSIYKQQDGGAAIWMETQNVTPDANGQYNVILGSTTATGLPDDLFLQQEQRWLGVQVQGEAEQARVLLVSVPYAFKAHEAETLGGLPASAFVKAPPSDASGSGSTGSNNGTSVNALGIAGKAGGTANGQGTGGSAKAPCPAGNNFILFWRPPGFDICPSTIWESTTGATNGYIGILTTTPSKPLDVGGIGPNGGEINARKWYDIGNPETRIVAVHTDPTIPVAPGGSTNLFVGWFAGGSNGSQQNGSFNTFTGFKAGFANNFFGSVYNTYNGYFAGSANVSGNYNTMVGALAGRDNIAAYNTCVGASACQNHRTGYGGTYVGNVAGIGDVAGQNNSFFGDTSGYSNKGNSNTFLGQAAGGGNVGNFNAFLGQEAGAGNHGNNNTFSGYQAGFHNGNTGTAADNNVFYGYQAGFSNTTGTENTYLGYKAGYNSTTGGISLNQGNTFVGWQAGLANTLGAGDTFVGVYAGENATSVDGYNTFVGDGAGAGLSITSPNSGAYNSFFGWESGYGNTTGVNNAFYGMSSGWVFNQGGNTSGSRNTYLGVAAGSSTGLLRTGNDNIFVGYKAGRAEVDVSNNIEIGNTGPAPLSPPAPLGHNTILIGTQGTGAGQQSAVFITPVLSNPTNSTPDVVTIATVGPTAGLLGHSPFPTGGGGNVVGPGNCLANFLTKWVGGNNVDCSRVWENSTPDHFVGIGTTTPSKPLDVNGEINARTWYDIGLPETPVLSIGPTVTFADGNLFVGAQAGNNTNIPGGQDTFIGYQAGFNATPATTWNTFIGYQAGYGGAGGNTGTFDTYTGWQAGAANTTGDVNVFDGAFAGFHNTIGAGNTFLGYATGLLNQDGQSNTYVGYLAGENNNGNFNSFFGILSGQTKTAGSNNIFLGSFGGFVNATGDNDIYIGNSGVAVESNTIRIGGNNGIGYPPQTDTYVAGIWGSAAGGASDVVCVDANGKLWGAPFHADCTLSSRRFKDQIVDMGDSTSKLLQLRPVTFFYKPQYDDGSHALQFGLIAEEGAKVYPEMVAYDKDGQPYTVKYQMLTPMLLNELQKQHTVVAAQQDELQTQLQQIKTQQQQMQAQRHEIDGLKLQLQQQNASLQERLSKLESYVATQMKTASDNPPRTTPGANGGLQ